MRDRLIELLLQTETFTSDYSEQARQQAEYKADYLLANGVVVPPVKVGDTVFFVDVICDKIGEEKIGMEIGEVVSFSIQKEGLWAYCRYESGLTYWHFVEEHFNKKVFLTREEAEKALAERSEKG